MKVKHITEDQDRANHYSLALTVSRLHFFGFNRTPYIYCVYMGLFRLTYTPQCIQPTHFLLPNVTGADIQVLLPE